MFFKLLEMGSYYILLFKTPTLPNTVFLDILKACRCCPVHCRMSHHNPGLYPLHAGSNQPLPQPWQPSVCRHCRIALKILSSQGYFGLLQLRERCYGHLVSRGQGCCKNFHNIQDSSPQQRDTQSQMSTGLWSRSSDLEEEPRSRSMRAQM